MNLLFKTACVALSLSLTATAQNKKKSTELTDWKWHVPQAELKQAKAALIPYPDKAIWGKGQIVFNGFQLPTASNPNTSNALKALGRVATEYGVATKDGVKVQFSKQVFKGINAKEAYSLTIDKEGIHIGASDSAGYFYAVQTLRQLVISTDGKKFFPFVKITDSPALGIRGFMHDVGRNFISIEDLKVQLDIMAKYKINTFQFHLTDNPANRVESTKYPQLNEAKNMSRWKGKFYTKKELKELVKFCADRHIDIIPELDMPGHSWYFNKALGFGMQTDQGVKVLKELVDEWCEIFPSKYFHLGTDEVKLTRPTFVKEMTEYVEAKGKITISWHHGLHPHSERTIQQLWNRPPAKNKYIDSLGYVNTDDPVMQARIYFYRQYGYTPEQTEKNLGAILCYWPDNPVLNTDHEMRIAAVYPSILSFAERSWQGNENTYPVINKETSVAKTPPFGSGYHQAFDEFEKRLVDHKKRFFLGTKLAKHFPYVRNAQITWKIIGPFNLGKNVTTSLPPGQGYKENYTYKGKTYSWTKTWGGTLDLDGRFKKLPKGNVVYAYTRIYSPKDQKIQAWMNFGHTALAWSGKEKGAKGVWGCEGTQIFVNGKSIPAPEWKYPGKVHIPLTEEIYIYRKPTTITLKKGWNEILYKAPNLFKRWAPTFVPLIATDKGYEEIPGLKFDSFN